MESFCCTLKAEDDKADLHSQPTGFRMIQKSKNLLGIGLYTPAEAALFARVRTQLITRWIFGDKKGKPVVRAQLADADDKIITFLDLVQALAIRAIRTQYPQISLNRIKKAATNAERFSKIRYPFAMAHTTFVYYRGESNDVLADEATPTDEDEDDDPICEIVLKNNANLTQVTGKKAGNMMIKEVAELYMTDLTFDESGMAMEYTPFQRDGLAVTLNPKKHFGQPLLPSNYTALALAEAAKTEGSIDAAARVYGVDRKEVELACGYFDFLQGPVTA